MNLNLPVRIQGHDSSGDSWEEMSSVRDVSAGGVAFLVKGQVTQDQVLFLALPLPREHRVSTE